LEAVLAIENPKQHELLDKVSRFVISNHGGLAHQQVAEVLFTGACAYINDLPPDVKLKELQLMLAYLAKLLPDPLPANG
jgi:hypothetical protein